MMEGGEIKPEGLCNHQKINRQRDSLHEPLRVMCSDSVARRSATHRELEYGEHCRVGGAEGVTGDLDGVGVESGRIGKHRRVIGFLARPELRAEPYEAVDDKRYRFSSASEGLPRRILDRGPGFGGVPHAAHVLAEAVLGRIGRDTRYRRRSLVATCSVARDQHGRDSIRTGKCRANGDLTGEGVVDPKSVDSA